MWKILDDQINLEFIIKWYKDICFDTEYRLKMYEFARANLQYDDTSNEILNRIGIN